MSEVFHVKQKALGKGLSALLGDSDNIQRWRQQEIKEGAIQTLLLNEIEPGQFQPRKHFDDQALQELATSIKQNGVLQPIVVRAVGQGVFEIVAGERRWRASKLAGKTEIPVVIKEMTDKEAMEIALLENVQRQDLNPLEEAQGYHQLIEQFEYTQEQLSQRIGKSRSHIANLLRLLALPGQIKTWLNQGKLSMGHARALLGAEDPLGLAHDILDHDMSVRETERRIAEEKPSKPKTTKTTPASAKVAHSEVNKPEDVLAIERELSHKLGLHVDIHMKNGSGSMTIAFHSLHDLDKILTCFG
ncbi:MAG: ParB/RepB/Spo0J family partition protein [Alphaproteobacteria bacterium]|nr:ParB/RepB/Spo0J family partition protein [Alphaproteobacteria bacterium]